MKRQDEKEMKTLYLEWMDSGKSKAEFAIENGIVRSKFYYWAYKFSKQESLPSGTGGFSLLAVRDNSPRPAGRAVARVKYPSGISVELYEGVTAGFILELTR